MSDVEILEGDTGTTDLTFTVKLSAGADGDVTVDYETFDGSAEAGSDYTPVRGTLTIPRGATTATVRVPVLCDTEGEADETVHLALHSPTGVLLSAGIAAGCVLNDDAPEAPTLHVAACAYQRVTFAWAEMPGATHYRFLVDPDGMSDFSQVGEDYPVGETTHEFDLDGRVSAWTDFRVRVEACNEIGCTRSNELDAASLVSCALAYLKASNGGVEDSFGFPVALSGDGRTLAVGAPVEDGDAAGVDGPDSDHATDSGAVYVFTLTDAGWSQQAYVKASNTGAEDLFGLSLALSGDGNTLAVGAGEEDGGATGVDGPDNDDAPWSGAAYVFTRAGTTWTQQAYVKASNTGAGDHFGLSLALSGDGNTLAVGAVEEDGGATGVDGPDNDDAPWSGAAYVFTRAGTTWTQQACVKASNTGSGDGFGVAVALSGDGDTLVVGADDEDGGAGGIDGPDDDDRWTAGAAYVFTRTGTTWSQQAYVKAAVPQMDDGFGDSVALSGSGDTLAVGAFGESSDAAGTFDPPIDGVPASGAAYVFRREEATWRQSAFLKAPNAGAEDFFGGAVALSGNGLTLAVGAPGEGGDAAQIESPDNDDAPQSGAVYVY